MTFGETEASQFFFPKLFHLIQNAGGKMNLSFQFEFNCSGYMGGQPDVQDSTTGADFTKGLKLSSFCG